jgi:uncharacterized membrane protein
MGMARSSFARTYLYHHARFYAAVLLGIVVYFLTWAFEPTARLAAGGDAFFVAYLIASTVLVARLDQVELKKRAVIEDDGAFIALLIALAVIVMCVVGIFTMLNQKKIPSTLTFALSVASAPLGWFTLHTIAAFHYANLHYLEGKDSKTMGLKFPQTEEPALWDFLYFSFVVGMTAQVSDVQVLTTPMRRATLIHSIVSFFFNTVLIAMAVNAAVATVT